jgi:butyrate kinase
MDLEKEEAVEVAAPILEEIRKTAAFRKNFIHAVIFTGILAHRSALSRALKEPVQELAPVLSFAGKPDARTVAVAAQKALFQEQIKPYSGGKH